MASDQSEMCPACRGSRELWDKCPKCEGFGELDRDGYPGMGRDCPRCHGLGEVNPQACTVCGGTGRYTR
jgi:molecular chaperone DnaJ